MPLIAALLLLTCKTIAEDQFGAGVELPQGLDEALGCPVHVCGSYSFFAEGKPDIVEAMDGAGDLFWVGVAGVSIIFGCSLEPVLNEIARSNQSKFIDGHRRDDGKWVKGPSYKPADIKSVLEDRIPF